MDKIIDTDLDNSPLSYFQFKKSDETVCNVHILFT